MQKKYLKIGLSSILLGLVAILYSYYGTSASADSLNVTNASTKTMEYIFTAGMSLVVLGIIMVSAFFTGKARP